MNRITILLIVCWSLLSPGLTVGQLIVAHRGASEDAPENTLAAFKKAWEEKADAIEADFHLTADGQIVCLHDKDTERTAGIPLIVAESTLEQLKQLDVGRWKGDEFAGERIPTLREVLQEIPPGKKLFLEIKCGPEILPELVSQIEQSELAADQIVIIAFKKEVIKQVRKQLPQLSAYWLVHFKSPKNPPAGNAQKDQPPTVDQATPAVAKEWDPSFAEVFETLKAISATGISCKANEALDQAFIKRLNEEKYEFHCWTVNDEETARAMVKLGVRSITTDKPGWLRDKLR